jgi:PAS domain S-box-containing protein
VSFGEIVANGQRAFTGFVRDITGRKRAEQAMARLAAIVESSSEAIIGTTLDGVIMTWNAGAERLYGYSAQEAVGRLVSMVMPPGCRDELPAVLAKIKEGQSIEHFETVRVRKDGRQVDVSLTVSPIRDAAGNVTGASRTSHDISRQVRTEAALRESEQRFRQLAENLREVFWVTDGATGRTLYVSPAYEEIWARTGQSLCQDARAFLETLHPQDRSRIGEAKRLQRTNPAPLELQYRIVRPDEAVRWIWDRTFPVVDDSGHVYRFVGIAEDISGRIGAEAELQHSLGQLRALAGRLQNVREEERTRVAREIHDELGQALTAIKLEFILLMHAWPEGGGGEPAVRQVRTDSKADRRGPPIGAQDRHRTAAGNPGRFGPGGGGGMGGGRVRGAHQH